MNKKAILISFLLLISMMGCGGDKEPPRPAKLIQFSGLNVKAIESRNVDYEGFVMGASVERSEVYIYSFSKLKRHHLIQVVDLESQKVKKEIQLKMGVHESPTEFFSPTHVQFCGDNYMIVDQFHKILVYDEDFNYLYTNMFTMGRYFLDFYLFDNQKYFVIGDKKYGLDYHLNNIDIYRFPKNNRPQIHKELHQFKNKSLIRTRRKNRKFQYDGEIWPAGNGFEKDGNIYMANHDERKIHVYNLKEEKSSTLNLDYLKPKRFSQETVTKFFLYKSDGWQERSFKRTGIRSVAVPYPDDLYHFGLYDVGEKKLGILGDLDTENYKFRLDILDGDTCTYLESIWLPFGDGFTETVSDGARGLHQPVINVDKGYYCWNNSEGEDLISIAHITLFKVLEAYPAGKNL